MMICAKCQLETPAHMMVNGDTCRECAKQTAGHVGVLTAAVPGIGVVEVPINYGNPADPRTIKIGPIPDNAKSHLVICRLPVLWCVCRAYAEKHFPEAIVEG